MSRDFRPLNSLVILAFAGAAFIPAGASASSFVFPSSATTATQSVAAVNTNATLVQNVTAGATSSAASATAGANAAHSSVDLLTGLLRVDGQSTLGFGPQATGWEFLTFSGAGTIDFAFDVDGTLRNFNSNGMVAVEASVFLFDVTTWSSYFGSSSGLQFVAHNGSGSPFPFLTGSDFDNRAVRGLSATGCSVNFITACVVDQVGTTLSGDLALGGSFTVAADRLYLLQLSLTTFTFNGATGPSQVGDFSHTAAFGFTNLHGLTFESASGDFLSQAAPAAVPEPGTVTLLVLGLGLSAWTVRRRSRT